MSKAAVSDEALFEKIRDFIKENPSITSENCDDEVARLIGESSTEDI